jgi:membrane-associated phospholipid phosphatase
MAVPLKKMVRGSPLPFDLRAVPSLTWGAFVGALKAAFSVSFILFLLVSAGLIVVSYMYVDRPVAQWLHKYEKSSVTGFFRTVTSLGSASVMLALPFLATGALVLTAFVMRNSERAAALWRAAGQAFFVFCCVALPAAIGLVAKVLIGRARPRILFDGNVYGFTPMNFGDDWHSMPSGHSLAAAGFAAGLALILPLPAFPAIAFFGAIIAFSRVATLNHYFGDALAGGALAIICTILLKGAFKGMGRKKLFPTWDPNKKLRLRSISRSMMRRG